MALHIELIVSKLSPRNDKALNRGGMYQDNTDILKNEGMYVK